MPLGIGVCNVVGEGEVAFEFGCFFDENCNMLVNVWDVVGEESGSSEFDC
jgi:hypothetical protein